MVQTAPRVAALIVALVLGLGLALHGVKAAEMSAKMAFASESGLPRPDNCGVCGGGDDGMPMASCYALCGGSIAVLPDAIPLQGIAAEHAPPPMLQSDPSRLGPPDPYPPKPALLS